METQNDWWECVEEEKRLVFLPGAAYGLIVY